MLTIIICVLVGVVYIICGILSYGIEFAYRQIHFAEVFAKKDYYKDVLFSVMIGMLWPFFIFKSCSDERDDRTIFTRYKATGIKFK